MTYPAHRGFGGDSIEHYFYEALEQHGYRYYTKRHWRCSLTQPPPLPNIVFAQLYARGFDIVFERNDAVIYVDQGNGFCELLIAAAHPQNLNTTIEWLKDVFPETETLDNQIVVSFWANSRHGPRQSSRTLHVPTWAAIRANYTADIQEAISPLFAEHYQPPDAGKLLLWRGQPGTGKTFALRALMYEWRRWGTFHYIVDPDSLFGSEPSYMMEVLNHDASRSLLVDDDKNTPVPSQWKVLLLEDCGEMLAVDAKANTGQGLSRLLNLVDGLVGQGLNILCIMTTNEELGRLHPAVSRPGRCLMNLEFAPLSHSEVATWAKLHGLERPPMSGRLADLYAALRGDPQAAEVGVGFVP